MMRSSACSLALGGILAVACSSASPSGSGLAAESIGTGAEDLTDLPPQVDETALDRTANPCDDFFQYACGGYVASVTLSSESERHSRAFDAAQAANTEALQEILATARTHRNRAEDRKVVDYDDACVAFNTARAPGKVGENLASERAAVRNAGRHGNVSAMFGRSARSLMAPGASFDYLPAFQAIIAAYPAPDRERDASVVALNVAPSYNLETDPGQVSASVAENYPSLSAADQSALADLVVRIDSAVYDTWTGDFTDYHPIGRAGLATAMPHIDWDTFFARLGAPDARRVVVWGLETLTKIDGVLSTLSADDLTRYLDYKLVSAWTWVEGYSGASADAVKTQCLNQTSAALSGIVEHRFVDTVLGKKNTKVAMAMAKAEVATFGQRLQTTEFLDDATRAEAIAKINAMQITPLLEPRDRYADADVSARAFMADEITLWSREVAKQLAHIDRRPRNILDMGTSFQFVNAFYDATTNRFTILPGIAHGGFFGGAKAPSAHNFGALGWVIGHEMTHGFDNSGRLYDGQGADRNWWTPAAEAAFNERAACFVGEYGSFVVDGVTDPATGQPAHINGDQTLGENIADNGGIRTAYQTAESYFASGKPDAGFTPQQQFFVAAGQTWCEKRGTANALAQLQNDPHSPGKARVNETLSNFDKFAEAFQCKAGDKMVAAPSCKIW